LGDRLGAVAHRCVASEINVGLLHNLFVERVIVASGIAGAGHDHHRFLQNSPFGPEDIARLGTAYEQALRDFGLKDRNDPLTELIAKKIIQVAQTGVRDPAQISKLGVKQLRRP
jgi:hypothetical protein